MCCDQADTLFGQPLQCTKSFRKILKFGKQCLNSQLTKAMCWELVMIKRARLNAVGTAIYRKPASNECYDRRPHNEPPLCEQENDRNAAWNVPLEACMCRIPVEKSERGSQWLTQWPQKLKIPCTG